MQWQPAPGKQLLAPFGHQVAGQSSMLCFDNTTVCKPLIAREHFVYQTLPAELQDFTPEYRGEDGNFFIKFIAYIYCNIYIYIYSGVPNNHFGQKCRRVLLLF